MDQPQPTQQTLATGLGLVESVRVHDGTLWYADWSAGAIHRHDVHSGADEVVATVRSLPLCFDFDPQGRLVALDWRAGVLLRGRAGDPLEPWVEVSHLAQGAGNEVLAVGDGSFYLNFGNFNPEQGFPTEPVGLVAHVSAEGVARVVAEGLAFPNGMALTPDGSTLVVAESYAGQLTAFPIEADGSLGERRVWAAVPGSAPDGISMSDAGTCWCSEVPGSVVVGVTEGGGVVGRVELDRGGFSCALSEDGTELYVAAARWPADGNIADPAHDWDGVILRAPVPPTTA
ncbi:SMP-30/gluconolactonase/LRE family protein [Knoellia koreensis]|uniref:SMP-30/gluconolactonase/LRE family protein n=1 Tax=Knoellia koreensis TaxID=2730921 RepID=A0A849HN71_9MICO|nr:SMP-30/gluconolactonase/LRE family protein [Knoellia sp. DB2414S]NNM48133.1 SMP-30/gluconolactonase/LRE family protein [Knoellia sp. DB2414S]